ncbi:DUF397 domain-containing protein [Micromonospora sp. NPDC050200]|uniref:DUF397 domain-containing protein n=1 Tax=Micromonospora sp. NPDC050200 TaxID=3155664 RepID=UPI0033FFDF63
MTPTISAALATATWRKSTYSGDQGACVELATVPDLIAVRDSKDPAGPVLLFPPAAWATFTTAPPRP